MSGHHRYPFEENMVSNPYDPSQPQPSMPSQHSWDPQQPNAQQYNQQYGQPHYGYTMSNPNVIQNFHGQWVDVSQIKSNSTIVLVLGILGILGILPVIGPAIAWIWGHSLLKEAQKLALPPEVVTSAKIGKILGIISISLFIAAVVLIAMAILVFSMGTRV